MQPSERLAAFLADELPADERRALEAELARDADLRSQLEAMRRADAALADQAPTALPEGAEQRLLAALAPTLDEQLGTAAHPGPADELAARRQRTGRRRSVLTAIGGVAAAVLAVAVVLPNLGEFGSGDDSAEVAMDAESGGAADDTAGTFSVPQGPTVTGGDRELDEDGADQLLASGELDAVVAQGLDPAAAAELGDDWAQALGATPGRMRAFSRDEATGDLDGEAGDSAAEPEEEAAETEQDAADAPATDEDRESRARALVGPDVSDTELADVGRCLDVLLAGGEVAIPVTAELVTFDGEPAVAFALVATDADGQVTRREVWVLERASCDVRYFGQA